MWSGAVSLATGLTVASSVSVRNYEEIRQEKRGDGSVATLLSHDCQRVLIQGGLGMSGRCSQTVGPIACCRLPPPRCEAAGGADDCLLTTSCDGSSSPASRVYE